MIKHENVFNIQIKKGLARDLRTIASVEFW